MLLFVALKNKLIIKSPSAQIIAQKSRKKFNLSISKGNYRMLRLWNLLRTQKHTPPVTDTSSTELLPINSEGKVYGTSEFVDSAQVDFGYEEISDLETQEFEKTTHNSEDELADLFGHSDMEGEDTVPEFRSFQSNPGSAEAGYEAGKGKEKVLDTIPETDSGHILAEPEEDLFSLPESTALLYRVPEQDKGNDYDVEQPILPQLSPGFKNDVAIRDTDFNNEHRLFQLLRLEGDGIPVTDGDKKQAAIWFKGLVSTLLVTARDAVPAGFAAAIIHDLIVHYAYPNERFGTELGDIFTGSALNEQGWSSHLGSYERGIVSPIVWPVLFAALPALLPLLAHQLNYMQPSTHASQLAVKILWGKDSYNEKKKWLHELVALVEQGGMKGYFSLFPLASIASSFNDTDLKRFSRDHLQTRALLDLKQQASLALHQQSGLTASYLSWRAGVGKSRLLQAYWVPALLWLSYALYANARYGTVFVHKVMEMIRFLDDQEACPPDNRYLWTEATANYECTACGDWPFVSYRESLSADGCLTMLLSQPLPPQALSAFCNQLGENRIINRIDFSAQPWHTWSISELENVLHSLRHVSKPGITLVKFSLPDSDFLPTAAHIKLFTDFINQVQPREVNLSQLKLNEYLIGALLANTDETNGIEVLSLHHNPLDDEGARLLATELNRFPQLKTLNLANTHLSDFGLQQLAIGMAKHSGILNLDLSNNLFSESGLLDFASHWGNLTIQSLTLSGNTLSSDSTAVLGAAFTKRPLQQFIAVNSNIDDGALLGFADGLNLTPSLILSRNAITDFGLAYFLTANNLTQLTHFDVAFNQLSDESIPTFNTLLASIPLQSLTLSSNSFTAEGLAGLLPGLSSSALHILNLEHMQLTNKFAWALYQAFENSTLPIKHLGLADTGLTNPGIEAVLSLRSKLLSLSLNDNECNDEVGETLHEFLAGNPQLERLNLAGNYFNGSVLNAFAGSLKDAQLSQLNVSGNALDSKSMQDFAGNLLSPLPAGVTLDADSLSLDARRALMRATPTSRLQQIAVQNLPLSAQERLVFDRLNTAIGIEFETGGTLMHESHFASNRYQFHAERSLPATSSNQVAGAVISGLALSPFAMSLLIGFGIAGVVILACLLYRGLEKRYHYGQSDPSEPKSLPRL